MPTDKKPVLCNSPRCMSSATWTYLWGDVHCFACDRHKWAAEKMFMAHNRKMEFFPYPPAVVDCLGCGMCTTCIDRSMTAALEAALPGGEE